VTAPVTCSLHYFGSAMGTKMTHTARAELTSIVRRRYIVVATGTEKRRILNEFTAVTGYHEKSAIRALNAEPTIKNRPISVRAPRCMTKQWARGDRAVGSYAATRNSPQLRPNAHLAGNACRYP